jgi:hypothetical protein
MIFLCLLPVHLHFKSAAKRGKVAVRERSAGRDNWPNLT